MSSSISLVRSPTNSASATAQPLDGKTQDKPIPALLNELLSEIFLRVAQNLDDKKLEMCGLITKQAYLLTEPHWIVIKEYRGMNISWTVFRQMGRGKGHAELICSVQFLNTISIFASDLFLHVANQNKWVRNCQKMIEVIFCLLGH